MSRYGFFIGIIGAVIGLCLFAWRLSVMMDVQEQVQGLASGAAVTQAQGLLSQAVQAQSLSAVSQAAIVAEVHGANTGSYAGLTTALLFQYDPAIDPSAVVAWASDLGYCVQAGSGPTMAHAMAAGPPEPGPCPPA